MKTMCPRIYHHNGFLTLGHMAYGSYIRNIHNTNNIIYA